jgi:hypothetical protein
MTRNQALEKIADQAYRAAFLENRRDKAPSNWMFVPYRHEMACLKDTLNPEDDDWGVLAIHKETLEPDVASGGAFMRSQGGAVVVDSATQSAGHAHQVQSGPFTGIWVWDTD